MKILHKFWGENAWFTVTIRKWQWGVNRNCSNGCPQCSVFVAVANKIMNTSKDNHSTSCLSKVTFRTHSISKREENWNVYPTAAVSECMYIVWYGAVFDNLIWMQYFITSKLFLLCIISVVIIIIYILLA
jgi:hypothetical protein